jgi:hypothetical protein
MVWHGWTAVSNFSRSSFIIRTWVAKLCLSSNSHIIKTMLPFGWCFLLLDTRPAWRQSCCFRGCGWGKMARGEPPLLRRLGCFGGLPNTRSCSLVWAWQRWPVAASTFRRPICLHEVRLGSAIGSRSCWLLCNHARQPHGSFVPFVSHGWVYLNFFCLN